MTNIMQNNKTIYGAGGGSVPSHNPQASTQSNALATMSQQKRSLNKDARKRELLKITMENQAFLRRL